MCVCVLCARFFLLSLSFRLIFKVATPSLVWLKARWMRMSSPTEHCWKSCSSNIFSMFRICFRLMIPMNGYSNRLYPLNVHVFFSPCFSLSLGVYWFFFLSFSFTSFMNYSRYPCNMMQYVKYWPVWLFVKSRCDYQKKETLATFEYYNICNINVYEFWSHAVKQHTMIATKQYFSVCLFFISSSFRSLTHSTFPLFVCFGQNVSILRRSRQTKCRQKCSMEKPICVMTWCVLQLCLHSLSLLKFSRHVSVCVCFQV